MEENFEGVMNPEWHRHDLKCLTSQISEHEALLRLKRRWLMDLPLSVREQKRVKEILPPSDKMLPESLIREDDVYYENIITFIEKGFGVHNHETEVHSAQYDTEKFISHGSFQDVFSLLDDMTNKGLCSFIEILTGWMVKFEKTNCRMKAIIRGLLQKVLNVKSDIPEEKLKLLLQLLKDTKNFRGSQMVCSTASKAYHEDAVKILNRLGDFPFRALRAMLRKLKGVKGYTPSIQPPRCGMGRDNLTQQVRKHFMKMLSDLGEMNEPSEQLAGALGVAVLTLKLIMNCPAARDFRKFSPETEALQNDIAKAIHLLDDTNKVSMIELKKVQELLDPSFRLSVRSVRSAIRNFLTDYLFECSDMDEIPNCILQSLDIINRRSQRSSHKKSSTSKVCSSPQELMKEVMQNEVECVLLVSAQAKEVILNLLPRHEFDEEFAHAYMETFEDSDTLCISDDEDEQVDEISLHNNFHSYNTFSQTESIGETNPGELNSLISTSEMDDCSSSTPNGMSNSRPGCLHTSETGSCKKSEAPDGQCAAQEKYPMGCIGQVGLTHTASHDMSAERNSPSQSRPCTYVRNSNWNEVKREESTSSKFVGSDFLIEEANTISQQSRFGNQYLKVQEACDATSMNAYHFVGFVLDKLAEAEGLELYQGDRLYLRSYSSTPKDSKEFPDTLLASEFSEIWTSVLQL